MSGPAAARLPDGRLHFQHGPIDLILEAFGPEDEVTAAYARAWATFRPVLDDLVAVLPLLRTPVTRLVGESPPLQPPPSLPPCGGGLGRGEAPAPQRNPIFARDGRAAGTGRDAPPLEREGGKTQLPLPSQGRGPGG